MIWFTSDTHFGHENVLGFCDRPWGTIQAMNDELIDNINRLVAPDDNLYHLGDYSFKMTVDQARDLRRKIRCRNIHLVSGNHDKDWTQPAVRGTFVCEPPIKVLKDGTHKLVLSHYPISDWQGRGHGSIHLHGHIHSVGPAYNEANRDRGIFRYDVGVDANGFRPVSLEEVYAWFDGVECSQRIGWQEWLR